MKHSIIFFLLTTLVYSQNLLINGKVVDLETLEPLVGVNIQITNSNLGTSTDFEGRFSLEGILNPNDTVRFSFLGYSDQSFLISELVGKKNVIKLKGELLKFDKTIIVKGIIAEEGFTPASFSKIQRQEIEENYTMQDIPEYLSYLPSTTFYSENGNGIGYNYLRIRGFGQRRISIAYNGIPQNDPEDHNVYWHNITDLLESAEIVQVQRGAGAGVIGYPSIGGSINIITSSFSDKPQAKFSFSLGSYNTRKYSAKFSSGLIDNKYSIYAKLSKVMSDGYRDNSWVDFNSYHVSAVRYDRNFKTVINLYGGPVYDGLAYFGIPKSYIKDKKLRKTNFLSKDEIEEFSQPHYELLNEFTFNKYLSFNSALFFVSGEGYFDYDGSWSIYYDDYFRLKENGFSEEQLPTNALIRAQVENKQWGWIPKLTWEHDNGTLIIGGEYRNHRSVHWGAIRYAENIPENVPQSYRYYYYKGGKDIINFFANESYQLNKNVNLLGEVQLSYHTYKLFDEKYLGNEFSINGLYINPRVGINYKIDDYMNIYTSFARVTREPRLKTYYDAAESSGGATPQFRQFSNGKYDYDEPLVKPETMNNIEMGARYSDQNLALNSNVFYMQFNDEIIGNGQLDRFGQPITGNVDNTIHIGLEIDGYFRFLKNFELIVNASYSRNFISEGSTFIEYEGSNEPVEIDLSDNAIAGFPGLTFNTILKGRFGGLTSQISLKYVGDYFSDNYDENLAAYLQEYPNFISYSDNKVENYFVANFLINYDIETNYMLNNINLFVQVNNIFNNLYASYATGGDYFPAAERNFIAGIKLGI